MKPAKQGLMIGFITDGNIPVEWMMRLREIEKGIPSGMFWLHSWYKGKDYVKNNGGWAKARTKVVEQAIANNSKWLLFLDDDILAPPDCIAKMVARMNDNVKIVTGIYYMKTQPAQPVIFKSMGSGPYYNFPVEDFFEIEGSGLGLTLIDMDVFDKFTSNGIPFFDENWTDTKADGRKIKVNIGEDHWFFTQSRRLGFKIYCDSSILADHKDKRTGIIYPGEEECNRIRKLVLEKTGREDIIEAEKTLFNLDKRKKTIVFYNATSSEFAGDELERRGVGGSEGDIIILARLFAKRYNVIVFCNCPRPGMYDGVHYLHVSDTEFMSKFETDLFICSRNTQLLADVNFKEHFNLDKVCLWTHDMPESYVFDKLPKAISNIDRIFALTKFHKEAIDKKFKGIIPPDKWFYARNGVDKVFYGKEKLRNQYKLIYTSTPFRGLDILLKVFPKIKENVPQAELHIFSSMKVYGDSESDDKYKGLYEKAKSMDGVIYHGTVTRKELAEHYKDSAIMAYPNTYLEAMCINAAQSIVTGTPIVTSNYGALPEVIPKGCGILIDGNPYSEEYQEQFIKNIVNLLTNKKEWTKMHNKCKGYDFSWETIAAEWIREFFPKDDTTFVSDSVVNGAKNINTKEYWNQVYNIEVEKGNESFRADTTRWDMIVDKIGERDVVLDVGCGTGLFLDYLKQRKPKTARYGIDISTFALEVISKRDPMVRLVTDVSKLPIDLQEDYFDVITIQHVIEHLDDPLPFIMQYAKSLAKDGLLVVVAPINDDEWHEHQKIYQIKDFKELMKNTGMEFEIIHRKNTRKVKLSGEVIQEAIAFLKNKK